MDNYVILTDSSCDLSDTVLSRLGVFSTPLTFRFCTEDKEYSCNDMPTETFYKRMLEGEVAKTSAVNVGTFTEYFEGFLSKGIDVLYIGFSSGLSTTFNSARIASVELAKKYPQRRIVICDSLCASAGLGLLLSICADMKASGKSIDEVKNFVEDKKLNICHWFTVNDLVYLKRGGRISPTTAFVGNMLGIKPIMHVDNEGHLVNVTKARGRRAAIMALADKFTELSENVKEARVFISHAYCEDDAKLLSDMIEAKHGVKAELITDVSAVIGAHSGPGTLALFFVGRER